MRVKIYSGLSLKEKMIRQMLPGAVAAGPIQRGDVLRDIESGINVIGIIDGVFNQGLAVSPNEIMDGIRAGVKFFGSSSMGALRAAELQSQGFVGVGKIYERLVESDIFNDDQLGLLVFDGDSSRYLSCIDLVFFIEDLKHKKKVTAIEGHRLLKFYKDLHYSDREISKISEFFLKSLPKEKAKILSTRLKTVELIKTRDAKSLLKKIKKYQLALAIT